MDPVIAMKRSHLAEAEQRYRDLDILTDGEVLRIDMLLYQHKDTVDINVDEGMLIMTSLRDHVQEMRQLNERISKLKEALGQ